MSYDTRLMRSISVLCVLSIPLVSVAGRKNFCMRTAKKRTNEKYVLTVLLRRLIRKNSAEDGLKNERARISAMYIQARVFNELRHVHPQMYPQSRVSL